MASVNDEWAFFQANFESITQRMQSTSSALPPVRGSGTDGSPMSLIAKPSTMALSDLYVSTMVILHYVSSPLDVEAFRAWVEVDGANSLALASPCKLIGIKQRKEPKKPSKKTGFFFSKAYQVQLGDKMVVVTLFADGILHMTGVKRSEDSNAVCAYMLEVLKAAPGVVKGPTMELLRSSVALMNAQFALPFFIDRQELYNLLKTVGLKVFFDPMVYQGVRVTLMWNSEKDGKCHCETPCKSHGKAEGRTCSVVTASVFRTGKVNIMGGKGEVQVTDIARLLDGLLRSQQSVLELANTTTARA